MNLGLLILRVAVGGTMLAHGVNHVWRGGRIPGTGRWFHSLGMKPGVFHAWLASGTELVAGAALIVGLLTPIAAGACAGVMLVALIVNHRKNGFFIFRPGEGGVRRQPRGCVLRDRAPRRGEWSLDNALRHHVRRLVGLISARDRHRRDRALLVTFWRPPAPAKDPAAA